MIQREDVERLLALHARAYELLLWLGAQAAREPRWLAPEVVTRLEKPPTAAGWLEHDADQQDQRRRLDRPLQQWPAAGKLPWHQLRL